MPNPKRVFGVLGNKLRSIKEARNLFRESRRSQPPAIRPVTCRTRLHQGAAEILVQSDVTAGAASLFARNPDWQFVFDTDKQQAVETRKKVYDMAASEKMMVQGYHIAFPSMVYVEKSGNGFRLVPAPWSSSI